MLLMERSIFEFSGADMAKFAQIIDFYLLEKNKAHWAEIQRLAQQNTPAADQTLTKYTLEGARLSNSLGVFRNVEPASGQSVNIVQHGKTITVKKGDRLFVSFVCILGRYSREIG